MSSEGARETAHGAAGDLRDQMQAALNDSEDGCARCQHCDRQLDAVMAVVEDKLETIRERLAEESAGRELAWEAAKGWRQRAEQAEAELEATRARLARLAEVEAAIERVEAEARRLQDKAGARPQGDDQVWCTVVAVTSQILAALSPAGGSEKEEDPQ